MFEKNIFSDDVFADKANETKTDSVSEEQKEDAYKFAQKLRKDLLEKILGEKSPEEKEKIIKAMISNLQEDLIKISDAGEKEREVA